MWKLVHKDLFGGAITANYPEGFIDASGLRQIPDTQEVYLSPNSNDSIVLETLKRVSSNDSSDAAKFHFDALAHDNEAVSSSVQDLHTILNDRGDKTPSVTILRGQQGVQKFNSTSVDDVRIFMALYRVEEKGVDLVLTLNFPMSVGASNTRTEEQYMKAQSAFHSISTSLRIVNFKLFA